jgi:hypothetical protein
MIPYDEVENEIQSSNIRAAGTVDDWLVITFKNGDVYRYKGMAHQFQDLIEAESVGKFFNQEIRHQSYERLPQGEWPED